MVVFLIWMHGRFNSNGFANGSYTWRGVEMTLTGVIVETAGTLTMPATESRPEVILLPLQRKDKVQLDHTNGVPNPLPPDEASAYTELATTARNQQREVSFAVTGPIFHLTGKWELEVRRAQVEKH